MNNKGFNTKTRKVEDMFESNIVNPANVELNAVKNAISVAAAVLTAPTLVTLPRQEQDVNPLDQKSLITR